MALQTLTSASLGQFKTLTRVYKDETTPQGRRPSDFIRLRTSDPLKPATAANEAKEASKSGRTAAALEMIDAPEMTKRPVTSRIIHVVPCVSGDPEALIKTMGYSFAYAYFEQGYQLSIGPMNVRVYQVFKAELAPDITLTADDSAALPPAGNAIQGYQGTLLGSGTTWIVQADVDVKIGSTEDLKKGIDELTRFKRDVHGYLEMTVLLDELR